jgi:DNA-binding protein Fis
MKSNSYNQEKIKVLSDMICKDIERLLDTLHIEDYRMLDNMVIMSCPIHGGDNSSAFNLYHTGDSYCGNWKCRSHKCEEYFKSSIIGFIRGCLSRSQKGWEKNGDEMVSFKEAIDFASKFINQDLRSLKVSNKEKEKNNFINTVRYINNQTNVIDIPKINRNVVRKNLSIPSQYFISRNFSPAILDKYDVGDCLSSNKEMSNRAVVPVYDMDHSYMIGCSGRAIGELKPKWKHSAGFKAENVLYNYWFAKEYIKNTGVVVLVESPGNVWKLEEAGIHNSVGIFGSSLADKQKMLLDISGAMTIVTIMDNDDAGKKASEQIANKCNRTYNIKNINIVNYNDIAEMPLEEIEKQINTKLKELIS